MNPVNMLQELMVSKKQNLPEYTFECSGSQPEIKFICTVQASEVTAVGEGRSKKVAKYLAAENALVQLGHSVSSTNTPQCRKPKILPKMSLEDFIESKNYIGQLHELASTLGVGYPIYEMASFSDNGQFEIVCKFQDVESIGNAENKKKAKQMASYKMMLNLNNKISVGEQKITSEKQMLSVDLVLSTGQDQISKGDILQSPINEHNSLGYIAAPSPNLESNPEPEIED